MKRYIPFLMASIAAAFAWHWSDLFRGFFADDPGFFRLSEFSLPQLWRADLGWFYRPVYLTWFWTWLHILGQNPVAFHATSIALHGVNVFLAGALIYRLSRQWWLAVAGAAFFLWLPVKVEGVWWISAASTLLATFFTLNALHAWLTFRWHDRKPFYWLTLFCAAMALCSKEEGLSVILLLPLIDWMFCAPIPFKSRVRWVLPFACVFAGYAILAAISWSVETRYSAVFLNFDARGYAPAKERVSLVKNVPMILRTLDTHWLGLLGLFSSSIWTLVGLGGLMPVVRRDRVAAFGLVAALLSGLPLAVLLGLSTYSGGRFLYLSGLFASVGGALLAWRLAKNSSIVGTALIAALAVRFIPIYFNDPLIIWSALFGIVAVTAILWRTEILDWRIFAAVSLLAVATQFSSYFALPLDGWKVLAVVAVALLIRPYWAGVLVAVLLWASPVVALGAFIAFMVGQRLFEITSSKKAVAKVRLVPAAQN